MCLAGLVGAHTLWAQETKEKVTVDDVDRNFMVRLPRGYDAQRHYPVVILLHGMNQDPDDMERLTRFDELADKDGIIAIYPFALHGRWNVGVRPEEHRPMTMGPGRGGRRGGGGGYPEAGVAIPVAGAIREAEDKAASRIPTVNRANSEPRLRRTTLLSLIKCSTRSAPSFPLIRLGSMRWGCRRVAL